jgi:hypothetical protein
MPEVPIPRKESTIEFEYEFVGWKEGEITPATSNKTYTAIFNGSVRIYYVKFRHQIGDGEGYLDILE